MTSEFIKLSIDEVGVARLSLARPDAYNAMSYEFVDAFSCVAESLDNNIVRVILITAEGKHFCVGGDVKSFAAQIDRGAFLAKIANRLHEGLLALLSLNAPIVTIVQGSAAGAGLGLVAASDFVFAAQNANFVAAYPGIGLTADCGLSWFLPRQVGLRMARDMMLNNRALNANEALACGLINKIVEDDLLPAEAQKLANNLANGPSGAFGRIRALLGASFTNDLEDQLKLEQVEIANSANDDGIEGINAFIERRRPDFTKGKKPSE